MGMVTVAGRVECVVGGEVAVKVAMMVGMTVGTTAALSVGRKVVMKAAKMEAVGKEAVAALVE